jgi:stage II sporulation protein D
VKGESGEKRYLMEGKKFHLQIPPLKGARGMFISLFKSSNCNHSKIKRIVLLNLSFVFCLLSYSSSVRVRLFTEKGPDYVFFKVVKGSYILNCRGLESTELNEGDEIIISRYKNVIALKLSGIPAFSADSVILESRSENPRFYLRTGIGGGASGTYSGGLVCYPDLSDLVIVNICDIEVYVAGVVMAEGGKGKNAEYFKTQAVIARTYTYKYFDKHKTDRYNLCDDTHCQSFMGVTTDSVIVKAVRATRDMVIVTSDSSLIIAAFHSNCGGETSPSEYVWLSPQPYLVKVPDPFCVRSRNASWEKMVSLNRWLEILGKNNYTGPSDNSSLFSFSQPTRSSDYKIEGFKMPLRILRDELDLKSTWFSVIPQDDSLYIRGRGYGHGIGLCQEGAMVMATGGSDFEEIIRFYYPGVMVRDIKYAKKKSGDR